MKSRRLHVQAQPEITDFNIWPNLLRPVPRNPSADRENSKSLSGEDMVGIAVEIKVRIESNQNDYVQIDDISFTLGVNP